MLVKKQYTRFGPGVRQQAIHSFSSHRELEWLRVSDPALVTLGVLGENNLVGKLWWVACLFVIEFPYQFFSIISAVTVLHARNNSDLN